MKLAKIITKDTPERDYKISIFVFVTDKDLVCSKCKKQIDNNIYCYLCSDYSNIFHKECFNINHSKLTINQVANQLQHYDYLVIIKFIEQDTYNKLDAKEINLYV